MASCAEGARAGSYGPCLPSFSALQKRYKNQPWHPWAPPVPSAPSLVITGMSATTTSPGLSALSVGGTTALSQRLSEQLEALSQVGESLTLRLLELEERLGGLEQKLAELSHSQADQPGAGTAALLAATEERIVHLEELLSEQPRTIGTVHPLPSRRDVGRTGPLQHEDPATADQIDAETELELNPFPDDEEQPFMDELSA